MLTQLRKALNDVSRRNLHGGVCLYEAARESNFLVLQADSSYSLLSFLSGCYPSMNLLNQSHSKWGPLTPTSELQMQDPGPNA